MNLAHEASGRNLLNDPVFLALAREYQTNVVAPARGSLRDVTQGHWYALALVPGRERIAIDRIADDVRVPLYLPLRRYVVSRDGRYRIVTCALFTGYGFARIANNDLFGRVISVEGVLGIMCEGDRPSPIRQLLTQARLVDGAPKRAPVVRRGDELVDYMRAVENGESCPLADLIKIAARRKPQTRKPRKSKKARPPKRARAAAAAATAAA